MLTCVVVALCLLFWIKGKWNKHKHHIFISLCLQRQYSTPVPTSGYGKYYTAQITYTSLSPTISANH